MKNLTKEQLYDWFSSRPIHFPAEYRLLEVFLISNFDESLQSARMTKAEVRRSTGFSKYLVNKYVKELSESGTWVIEQEGNSHVYTFTPAVSIEKN